MKRSDIISNTLFWVFVGALNMAQLIVGKPFSDSQNTVVYVVIVNLVNVLIFYLNYLYFIPKILINRFKFNALLYVLVIVFTIVLGAFVKTLIFGYFKIQLLEQPGKMSQINEVFFSSLFIVGFFIVSSLLIKFSSDWFSNERMKNILLLEKKEMEIAFLRSQLNPHFLFNSLNNIYSLAHQKSEKTPEAILKLSDIMRYMIYESNENQVSVKAEIDYLMSYIELNKLRYKDKIHIHFHIHGEITSQTIIPLLFISFVENAFKHGVLTDENDPVSIELMINQQLLSLSVSNQKNKLNKDLVGGLGLKNVERRLELMYPNRYEFKVKNTPSHYSTQLIINL